jgi:integrase
MSVTVRAMIERYLEHCRATGVHGAEARVQRQCRLTRFCDWKPSSNEPAMGEWPVEQCNAHHLEDFIVAQAGWKSTATRKACADQVNAVFNWAVAGRRITFNPFSGVRFPEADPRPPLADKDLNKLMKKAHFRFRRFLEFLRLTGRRIGEVFNLKWEHIDWDNGYAILPWQLHKSGKRTKKPLTIALTPEAIALLREIEDDDHFEGVIFRNTQGNPWRRNALGLYLRRLKEKLGLDTKATLHGIRHQVATEAIRGGANLVYLSKALGHANTLITQKQYAHVDTDYDAQREALAKSLKGRR